MAPASSVRSARRSRLISLGSLVVAGLVGSTASAFAQAGDSQDVVTRASPTWDPSAIVTAGGKLDSFPLRKASHERLAHDDSPVVLLHGSGPLDLGLRICEAVVPRRPPATPVLVKPNLGGFDWFKVVKEPGGDDGVHGRITQPEFVRGIVRCLKARGHTRITVADGWDGDVKAWRRLIKLSGYEQMAREEGVKLTLMNDDGEHDVDDDQPGKPIVLQRMEQTKVPTLMLPKLLVEHLQHGLYVSVPRLKAHRFAVVSVGIKANQGIVMTSDAAPAYHQKWRLHREINGYLKARKAGLPEAPGERAQYVAALEVFAERMADVLEVAAPDAVLVDAAPGMGGDGFQKLWPMTELFALGGTNVVRVDRVGAQLLGLWDSAPLAKELNGHRTSPLIPVAAKRFEIDLATTKIIGDGAALLGRPRPIHYVAMAPFSIHTDAALPLFAKPGTTPPPVINATPDATPAATPTGTPKPAPGTSALAIARAPALGKDTLKLDGKGDDPAWQRAPAVVFATDHAGRPTKALTRVRFLWAPGALYTLWEIENTDLFVDTTHPVGVERKDLYVEDCVEILLAPKADELWRFFEIELGPRGHFFDLAIDMRAKPREKPAWSSGVQTVTQVDPQKRRAVIEAVLRGPDIARLLRAKAELAMGLFRTEGGANKSVPRQYLAWRPALTPRPNFHLPEGFGVLVLE